MTELEQRIREQVDYCLKYERFRSVIYLSSKEKLEKVKNILMKYIETLPDKYTLRADYFGNEFTIDFINSHSSLKIVKRSDCRRGLRITGCLIDKDISEYIKRTLIYPKLIPAVIDMQNGIHESHEELWKKVHEVKI